MNFHFPNVQALHIHYHGATGEQLAAIERNIMLTKEQLAEGLAALTAQSDKARAEIVGKIAALEAAIDNSGNVDPAVEAAFNDLKASVQGVDDIVADEPPPPAP